MAEAAQAISVDELVELGAIDSQFFCETFFPRTARQRPALFHPALWGLIDDPTNRLLNVLVFRGGAKTSILRMYTAKRIAYGLAHTILYVGKSEGHAVRSINWLRTQIERNRQYSQIFSLRPGKKWQDTEAEIWHGTDEYPIWIMGMGITGSVRGINRDDFRPDLIVLDDIVDDENAATLEQREKIKNLVYGAIEPSLAPRSEAPDAKLVMLQTPQSKEDVSMEALANSTWVSARFGCWTGETEELPPEKQESSWPARWTSQELREKKEGFVALNKLSVWMREYECKITSPELSAFKPDWLRYYDPATLPERLTTVIAIDPVPPPSEAQVEKGLQGKDFEALAVVGRNGPDFYLLEYSANTGHDPTWTVTEMFRLALRWRPLRICVEAVAYQRVLAWLLRKAMEQQRKWYVVKEIDTGVKSKFIRIVDALSGVSSAGHLYVQESHTEFISQFSQYPAVAHEDILESVAVAVTELSGGMFDEHDYEELMEEERDIPDLEYVRGAP